MVADPPGVRNNPTSSKRRDKEIWNLARLSPQGVFLCLASLHQFAGVHQFAGGLCSDDAVVVPCPVFFRQWQKVPSFLRSSPPHISFLRGLLILADG